MTKKSFIYGAGILSGAGIAIKIIGACFRIPLGNMIGDAGMGYYNAAYPIYTLLLVIATTGIPIAVSRMVAEHIADGNPGGAHRVFKVAAVLMFAVGVCFCCLLFFGADFNPFGTQVMEGASYARRAIAPALAFVPAMAVFRGYFQGMQDMKPTAGSQIVEQLARVVVGLGLAFFMLHAVPLAGKGAAAADAAIAKAAAGGTFGATAGAVAGLAVMFAVYDRFRHKSGFRALREEARRERALPRRESPAAIIRRIIAIALPITVGAAVMPLMYNIDMLVVPSRLMHAGFSAQEATAMYGQLTGFAEPITNLPKVLTQAIAISMIPTIVRAWKDRDSAFLHYNVQLGLRLALIIGLPCTVGLMILAEPIMLLLYPTRPEAAVGAAPALFIFAIGVVFLSAIDALTSALQGIGKQMIPFANIAVGALCKLGLTYALAGTAAFNIKGAALGTVSAYAVATLLNYRAVVVYTGARFDVSLTFVRPLASAAVMGAVSAAAFHALRDAAGCGNAISAAAAILIGAVVYIMMIFVTRSLEGQELRQLPKGEKMYRLYRKIRPARNVKLR